MEDLGKCSAWRETSTDVAQMHTWHGCQRKIHSYVVWRIKCLLDHKQCWWRGSVLEFSCSFVIQYTCEPIQTYIHIHTHIHIHIHIHTSYMDTVMDPYEHILSLTLTFQLSDNYHLRFSWNNELCWSVPRLDWLHQDECRSTSSTSSWWKSTHSYMYIHRNSPFRVRIRMHIRDRNSLFTSFGRIHNSTYTFWVISSHPAATPVFLIIVLSVTFFTLRPSPFIQANKSDWVTVASLWQQKTRWTRWPWLA